MRKQIAASVAAVGLAATVALYNMNSEQATQLFQQFGQGYENMEMS